VAQEEKEEKEGARPHETKCEQKTRRGGEKERRGGRECFDSKRRENMND